MIDPGDTALLAGIAFVGALIFGVTGFGSALVTIPLASHFVSLPFALALFAVCDLAAALRVGLENPRNAVRVEYYRLVPTIVVGTILGVTALVSLPRQALMAALGLFVVAFGVYSLVPRKSTNLISTGWAWLAGFGGGITSTVFGAGGPPYVIYLSHRGLTKEQFRATLGFCTMTSISLRVLAFIVTGLLLDARVWLTAVFAVPAILLGIFVSQRVYFWISREALMKAVAIMLLASGGSLIWRALG
ncbi:MAG TPA: sulfite exporter TauE/SafE family protein [Burkholderiales bacterium]|jgi:hypothetical protein